MRWQMLERGPDLKSQLWRGAHHKFARECGKSPLKLGDYGFAVNPLVLSCTFLQHRKVEYRPEVIAHVV